MDLNKLYLDKKKTPKRDKSFPSLVVFWMLHTNPFSKLLHHVTILRNLHLKLQKGLFLHILSYCDYDMWHIGEILLRSKLNILLGLLAFKRNF